MKHILAFVVLAVGMGRTAYAQQYTARRAGELIRLEDTRNQMVVSIISSLGNVVSEFSVKGHNVLRWPYASLEDFKARGGGLNGIPFLGPWANRLDEQAFYANGKKYAFDMDLGNVRGAIPIHGFLTSTDQWQVLEVNADSKSAWVSSKLEVWKQPMWMKQWPFAHTVEITHRLQDGMLQVETKITNLSAEPMPVAVGFHPYYQLTDSPREDWTITVPAKTHYLLSGAKLPTGETEAVEKLFPNREGTLKDYNLDDVFGDLERDAEGRAHTIVKGKQQMLDIMFSRNYQAEVIFSPNPTGQGLGGNALQNPSAVARGGGRGGQGGRGPANPLATPNFICVEPMPGITNAINLAQKGIVKNLQSVAPNQSWEASFWVKPNGF